MNRPYQDFAVSPSVQRGAGFAGLRLLAACVACLLLVACSGGYTRTVVQETWKDPKYKAGPLKKVFVLSLMKIEPGGREAVEDALVVRLQSAGVAAVAAHTLLPRDAQTAGPTFDQAVASSGADAILVAQVHWLNSLEPYMITEAIASPAPNVMGESRYLSSQGANQRGDYKVARIHTDVYRAQGAQIWAGYSDSYDAVNLARNIPDYTIKIVAAMSRDGIVARSAKPPS